MEHMKRIHSEQQDNKTQNNVRLRGHNDNEDVKAVRKGVLVRGQSSTK